MLSKKIIFLTGATGTMGEEGLKQILSRSDRFNLRVLVRPSAKNKAFMSRYEHDTALEIVWGDLCCYDDILRCVTGADYVLHVGAFVSPEADKLPQRSLEVNLGSTMNIIRAIKAVKRRSLDACNKSKRLKHNCAKIVYKEKHHRKKKICINKKYAKALEACFYHYSSTNLRFNFKIKRSIFT